MKRLRLNRSAPFDLDRTLSCGQVFRWEKLGEWWYGVVGEKVVKIHQLGGELEFEGADTGFVKNYFRLDDDLQKILSEIRRDSHIRRAVEALYGLRIIRQEPWECLISYICSAHTNISAIKNMLKNLSRRFGEKLVFDGKDFYTFPRPRAIAGSGAQELRECKLGFRAKPVLETARIIYRGDLRLGSLRDTDYEGAKRELLELPGVGPKVADCVLLFSLEKLEAFPVDVWVKNVVLSLYGDRFESKFVRSWLSRSSLPLSCYERISSFGREYFGRFAGYAQEYLFTYYRGVKLKPLRRGLSRASGEPQRSPLSASASAAS